MNQETAGLEQVLFWLVKIGSDNGKLCRNAKLEISPEETWCMLDSSLRKRKRTAGYVYILLTTQ